ncbi:MAG: glycosyltransferase family 4 protein [Bacillota bacterium]
MTKGKGGVKGGSAEPAQPLRILLFSHYFWPESFRINQVAEDLISAGAEVTVLTGFPSYPEGRTYPGYRSWRTLRERHPVGYEIMRVPVVPRRRGTAIDLACNYLSFLASGIVAGTWLLRGRRFDILFNYCTTPVIQGYVGLWLRFLKGGKLVLWVQDLWPQALSSTNFVRSPLLLRAVEAAVGALYKRADLVLGQSRAFVRHIGRQAGNTPVRYFPNPGEHSRMPGKGAPELPPSFNIVFAGNLGTVQSMESVVEAAGLLRDDSGVQIILFGSGSRAEWIAREIEDRGLTNLRLGGRLPPDQMPGLYSQCSALLLTLVDDPVLAQTVPSKLQSYLAAGRPVIAAVNGEAADIVAEARCGITCPAGDPAALAEAVRRLKAMPAAEREAMGKAGRAYFEAHYEPELLARQLVGLFDELAEPGSDGKREERALPAEVER